MAFVSQKASGKTWNPTKDENGDPRTEAKKEDFIDGYYVKKKENVGEHNSNVYTIKTDDGEDFDVWGTKTLNDGMDEVRLGSYIRIQWHGKLLTKKGADKKPNQRLSTDSFHSYEVFVDNDKSPMKNDAEQSRESLNKPAAKKSEVVDEDSDLPF